MNRLNIKKRFHRISRIGSRVKGVTSLNYYAKYSFVVPVAYAGGRVDKVLADLQDGCSRAAIQSWIAQGFVIVDDEVPRQKDKLQGGERVEIMLPEERIEEDAAQPIALDIVDANEDLIVVNKPAGLVVHPGAGNHDGTMLNGLLHHFPELARLPRAGIVHRLDKDTSGLLVVSRNERARLNLINQLSTRKMKRQYRALVLGDVISGGEIDLPLARDKFDRRKIAVVSHGKEAITRFSVAERFRGHTLLKVELKTGRTHQIRVHMAHRGFPLVGDGVYGYRLKIPSQCHEGLSDQLRSFRRQALHAETLGCIHPTTDKAIEWQLAPPEDMRILTDSLRRDMAQT